ncbi:23S rRNA (uracil(1939)-C(5))-methyltransferase RlmD [Candidatus Nitrotoga sp. M5]|uniref:23S rRNA (uracil(1939)-C(5))-methyltransferase RlmD n=1 Tax=Candidatus Nitrotoga sp. M5 TaxID=2890409 RepID=UPI001EF379C7|nr:23S rRNA (uracil(1939)-C(5))-methyltransferase RlmD [Candidatus Nitrotoga sp. M5]CAH1386446.1 23S rRNA (uracil(1939)-C(5))-methyltransferase RlmD [Candidatus Nitrotoga sp. M5]
MTNKSVHVNSVVVESLDFESRGIAHVDGKVIFIEGALTGERVTYSSYRKKPSFEIAQLGKVIKPTFMRVQPKCKHFGMCGGCSMQHMDARAQVAAKQRILEDNLWHIGKVKAQTILLPIYGQSWGYRQRARLSVRHVLKKGKTLVGFREKRGGYVADMQSCEILTPKIAKLLPLLGQLNEKFTTRDALPQIEVAVGEHVDVLVLRILQALSPADEEAIKQFADTHTVQFWLQTKGPETAVPFYPLDAPQLTYSLPEFGITMPFSPTEFTQVNADMNRVMVSRAMRLLNPQPNERIADLFCGLGNFTLPIARSGAQVVGIEGSATLVQRAAQNSALNGLADNTQFSAMNLFEIDEAALMQLGHFDKMLIDPPRDGAFELVKALGTDAPVRIVYVSCNPATLARDAEILVHQKGYVLKAAGVMNMFPHTSHVESIALFEKSQA